jgi:hypothetical protein
MEPGCVILNWVTGEDANMMSHKIKKRRTGNSSLARVKAKTNERDLWRLNHSGKKLPSETLELTVA